MQHDLSIVIVNWNTCSLLRDCLASIYSKPSVVSFEVFVVDNNSTDGSADMVAAEFPQVNLIKNNENLGYGRANNIGIRAAKAENILLLNSDTVVDPNVFTETLHILRNNSEIGVLGCKLIGLDGDIQDSYNIQYPFGPTVDGHELSAGLIECALVWGAYFLIKREVIEEVGAFDEDIFMFYEDVDFCWRIHDAGWKIVYDSNHSIKHISRASCSKTANLEYNINLFVSERIMFKKRLPHSTYGKWWRKRFFYHVRCISLYFFLSHISKSPNSQELFKIHLAGCRVLLSQFPGSPAV
ncbi:MAG: glycosyltransferase family 2 protein [Armatimonadota bacterium]